jgi:dissimilatory sulfite reductase (desulfoviridin) alpha/beta subunit
MRKVSINFCGGCNPRIERSEIAQAARVGLEMNGFQVSYNTWDAEFTIYLSGCTASCARRYHEDGGPGAVVAGDMLDAMTVEPSILVSRIVEKVKDYFEHGA